MITTGQLANASGGGVASELPPGPDLPSGRVGQLWIEQPIQFWEDCVARFGDAFTIELGSLGTSVVFGHPEAVRQIFQLPPDSYECRPFNEYYKSVMGTHALFLSDGAGHRRMRRVLIPPLHRKLVETHGEAIRRLVREVVATWPAGEAFTPRPAVHLLSLKVMLRVIFGAHEEDLGREIARVFVDEIYRHLGSWSAWTRFGHLQPRFRDLIGARIRHRRGTGNVGGETMFDALLGTQDEAGAPLGEEEIEDHLFTMFVAGVDPTALALTWALYWVHEDAHVLARLRQEVAGLGPDAAAGQIAALPYLSAVCQETLRMYPIPTTPSGRKLVAPAVVHGRRYGPGVTLLPCIYLVHRNPDLYPEPARFRPERFLERQYAPHEYFPFGGGVRTCVGASLAPLEMKLALAEIVTRYNVVPAHTGPVVPARHGTLLAPSDTLRFVRPLGPSVPGR